MKRTKRQALGQHFLRDPHVLRKIIRQINPDKEHVYIEIGAGKGALTKPLAEKAGKVYAIEKDKTLIPVLKEKLPSNVVLVGADVLKVRFKDIVSGELHDQKKSSEELSGKKAIIIVGNLPYSVASPVLFKVLEEKDLITECTFLLQKEVGDRICATPGSKKYAPISILFQRNFDIRLCFVVEPGSFSPPPKVRSALLQFKKRIRPLFELSDEEGFRSLLKSAFRHRRKTLIKNLCMSGISDSLLADAFSELGLHEKVRPEQVTPQQFAGLFNFLGNFGIIET
ncbi:MAG: 16S rRNA (adenine(1518)-N(6)/adenine(1519)-N(6))-dimethyltransferase RsmA [Candidatus Aminicenantes bacterium]|jgi:16S rRNA (adenine1518-N6/adenine1519-N6)-dimethyltransferase